MPTPAHPRPLRVALALVAGLLSLLLAACGPDDRPTGENVPLPSVTDRASKTPGAADGGAGGTDRPDKGGKGKADKGDDDDDGGGNGGDGGGGGGNGGGGGGGGGGGNDGGGGGPTPSGGGGAPSGPPIPSTKTTLNLSFGTNENPAFDPPGLSAPPGTITLVFRNPSATEHAIAIQGEDFPTRQSRTVKDGQTVRLTVRLPAGDYEFFCPVDEHRSNIDNPETGVLSVG